MVRYFKSKGLLIKLKLKFFLSKNRRLQTNLINYIQLKEK